jgi:hypothetical protein
MNFIRHIGVLLLALMSTAVWAQTVSGTVMDENNQPLPGATVIVQGTTTGTFTDFDGKYQINAAQGQTLVFSYVGYATQNVVVNNATHDVSLQPSGQSWNCLRQLTAFWWRQCLLKTPLRLVCWTMPFLLRI